MANENQLVLEIVLDDGSIQRGFAKVKQSGEDAAKGVGQKWSEAFKIDGLADLKAGIDIATFAAQKLLQTFRTIVDLPLQAENIRQINNQFAILTDQAGIATEQLQSALVNVANGLVDTEDLLKSASTAVINLGQNAQKLPQIFELARSVTQQFGGTILERFDQINLAVATGNSRVLRQIGLLVDFDAAIKKSAASLGLQAQDLDENQQQFIRLNAILEKGSQNFGNTSENVNITKESIERLKVAIGELGDATAISFDRLFGPFIRGAIKATTDQINLFASASKVASGEQISIQEKIALLTERLQDLQLESGLATSSIGVYGSFVEDNAAQIASLEIEIANLNAQLAKQNQNTVQNAVTTNAASDALNKNTQQVILNNEQLAKQIALADQREAQVQSAILAQENQTAQISIANAQNELEIISSFNEQKRILDLQFFEQQRKAAADFAAEKGFTEQQLYAVREANLISFNARQEQLEKQKNDKLKQLEKAKNQESLNATSQALGQIATLQQNATGELAEIGKAAAITQATIDGYTAVQNALAKVPFPFNFAAAALVGVAAAANIAKIAAVGGGGGASTFSPATGGGAVPEVPQPTEPTFTPTEELTRQTQTTVNLQIMGDVLDSDESSLRIVKLLNEAYDKQGVVVRRGVFA